MVKDKETEYCKCSPRYYPYLVVNGICFDCGKHIDYEEEYKEENKKEQSNEKD